MAANRSVQPMYTPYRYLELRGGHVVSGLNVTDSAGNVVDFAEVESIQIRILQELIAIRIMLTHMSDSKMTDSDISSLE